MRVLLIEDEPTTAKAIELMLTTEGFNVYSTDLGECRCPLIPGQFLTG
jgi:two-component system cell cycle response regulator CtrA